MSDHFDFNNYPYHLDDQRTPDETNVHMHMFPEPMYEYPVRMHSPWEVFQDHDYYIPPEYPHPLMICPPATVSGFDDLIYTRREFQSPNDSIYMSTESSPTVSNLVTLSEEGDDEEKPTNSIACKQSRKSVHEAKKPQQTRSKERKKCHNCLSTKSPSWRRGTAGPFKGCLLCNACGLYEKTSKSKRMLVSDEDGTMKVVRKRDKTNYSCRQCHTKDSTRWKKFQHKLYCEKCAKDFSKVYSKI